MKKQMMIVQDTETTENSGEIAGSPVTTLAECEEIIQRGLGTFFEVGNALLRIRDQRLYRSKHRNFQEYCRERWNFGRAHANRLLSAAQVSSELSPIGDISHESQIRPLIPLAPEKRKEAWVEALKVSARPTEKEVKAAVQKVTAGQVRLLSAPPKAPIASAPAASLSSGDRCRAFLQLATDEVRELIDLPGWCDLREALLRLREDLEGCGRVLDEGPRQCA